MNGFREMVTPDRKTLLLLRMGIKRAYAKYPLSDFDPPCATGMFRWLCCTREVRRVLDPLGFEPRQRNNLAITVHPEGLYGILVNQGDGSTGNIHEPAMNSTPKGPATSALVGNNASSFHNYDAAAWGLGPFPPEATAVEIASPIWWMLLHLQLASGEIKTELSLPAHIDACGKVAHWRRRLTITDHGVQTGEIGVDPSVEYPAPITFIPQVSLKEQPDVRQSTAGC